MEFLVTSFPFTCARKVPPPLFSEGNASHNVHLYTLRVLVRMTIFWGVSNIFIQSKKNHVFECANFYNMILSSKLDKKSVKTLHTNLN